MRPRPWFLGLLTLLGLLLLALAGFIRPVRGLVSVVFLPVARFTSALGAGLGRALRLNEEAQVANERVRELEARLRSQTVDYVRLRTLEEENRSLRAQAKFISEAGLPSIGARVIARAMAHQTAAVTLDRGARDGVEVGQAVVTDEGLLVGKIASLGERTSTVLLVSDMRFRVAASIAGQEQLVGLVEGRGNGVARLSLIPQAVSLKRDDVIVSAGTEEKIPSNLTIGVVNGIQSQPTDPFQSAALEPLAPLDRLELVSVIILRAKHD